MGLSYRPRLARLQSVAPFFFLSLSYLFRGAAWKTWPFYTIRLYLMIMIIKHHRWGSLLCVCIGAGPSARGLLWALNLNQSGLCFRALSKLGARTSRRSPWADSYTSRHPWTPRGQAKPGRSSSSPSPESRNRGHQALLLVPTQEVLCLLHARSASGLCQVLGNRGTQERKSRRLVGRWFPPQGDKTPGDPVSQPGGSEAPGW